MDGRALSKGDHRVDKSKFQATTSKAPATEVPKPRGRSKGERAEEEKFTFRKPASHRTHRT